MEDAWLKPDERVATLAWNGYRHLELYYSVSVSVSVSVSGAVLHTLNPRLHADQLVWMADDAEDRVLFFDLSFLPLVQAIAPAGKPIRHFVLMCDRDRIPPDRGVPGLSCYEDLVGQASDRVE
jgi:acyl-CoA synthetase (AMP-forming)/AMP-acid ligase II